jgi:uncharacterized membrane protein YfcA
MKLTQRNVTAYGFVMLALMVLMLGFVIFGQLSSEWKRAIFFIALILFLLRVALRLILARQERFERQRKELRDHARENDNEPKPET